VSLFPHGRAATPFRQYWWSTGAYVSKTRLGFKTMCFESKQYLLAETRSQIHNNGGLAFSLSFLWALLINNADIVLIIFIICVYHSLAG